MPRPVDAASARVDAQALRSPSAVRARVAAARAVQQINGNATLDKVLGGSFFAAEPAVPPASPGLALEPGGTAATGTNAPESPTERGAPTGPAPPLADAALIDAAEASGAPPPTAPGSEPVSAGAAGAAPEPPRGLAVVSGTTGFFGAEPAPGGVAAVDGAGAGPAAAGVTPAGQVADGTAAGPAPPGKAQTVSEWQAAVTRGTSALPHPTVTLGRGGFDGVATNAADRGAKARGEVATSAQRQVPPRPRVLEPVKPPADPVPEATKTVTEAAKVTLPDLELPVLQPTPTGRKPELPPPRPVPPAKEPGPLPAKPAKGAKAPAVAAQLAPKVPETVAPQADQGPPPPPTLKDVRVPIGKPLPPELAMRIGDVVGRLLGEVPAITDETLEAARRYAFPSGKLTQNFPKLNDDQRPPLTTALTEQVNLIGDLAGITRERVQGALKARADALAASQPLVTVPTEKEAKAAVDAVKKEERKTATAITTERAKALKETATRMHKAMTSTNPALINEVRDELIATLRVEATRGAAQQRRAGVKRTEELAKYERLYIEAYRKADNADIPGTSKGIASINRDPATQRPWFDVRSDEVATWTKDETKNAADKAEALARATEAAALVAYELVRKWAATQVGVVRDIDTVRIEKFADQRAQAERRTVAEAEVKAEEARNALLGDMFLIDQLAQDAGAEADAKEKAGAQRLTAEDRKMAEQYFGLGTGPRDPVAALARTTRGRLVRDRMPDLTKTFKEKVEALDPFTLPREEQAGLAEVLWGEAGAADRISTKLFAAMDVVGTEEQDIYDALDGLNPPQARLVRAVFLRDHEHNLEWAIRDEMSGSERSRALALATGDRIASAAETLYDAVDGPGTNEKLVYSTLRGLTKEELVQVKEYYKNHHNKESLEKALEDDFSDREKSRALALASGDVHAADAYGIEEALHGSIWGVDRKGLEEVHKEIADDVGKANPRMTSEELAKEVRRRTGEVEASYEKTAGEPLKTAYGKLQGPTKDLAIALVDNDQDGADAARMAVEAQEAQAERRTADDQFNDIVKARHERMLDKARRDDLPALEQKLAAEIADRDAKGNPMTPEERQKAERDMQVELGKKAQQYSKEGVSTLEARFDEKYVAAYGRYDPDTGVYESKTGGFKVMTEMLASTEETKAYLKKGHLTLAEEVRFSVQGTGTNEERLKSVTKGRTKDELKAAREEYQDKFKEDMDWRIHDEIDKGTRDDFDIDENLRGVPETPEEMLDAARRRYTFETTTYGAGGRIELAPGTRRLLDRDYKDMQTAYDRLRDPDPRKRPTGAELDKLYGRFESTTKTLENTAEAYRKGVDSMVDAIVQVVAAVVAVAVIIATWGTATPLVAALYGSLLGTVATITTKMVLLGKAYGVEDIAKDVALGAVDAAVAVATAGMGDKILKVAKGAANPGVLARMAANSNKLVRLGAKASAEVIEQTAQAAPNALAATLLDDNTYRGDVFKNILKGSASGTLQNVGTGLAMGTAMRLGTHVAGGLMAGWRSIRGLPPPNAMALVDSARVSATERAAQPGRPTDALELRGSVRERAAAWADFRNKYPGASYERDFLPALDRGAVALQASADAFHQAQRQMRKELLSAVPPELRGQFAETPIHVVSDADFKTFARSDSGQAVVIIVDGKPQVVVRESAGPGALREEGIHLWQSADPRTAAHVAALDEAKLSRWDSLSVAEKMDLYRTKLALEIDGQHRLITHLDDRLSAAGLDPRTRAALEADLRGARRTLENLSAIQGQVDLLHPDDLLRISRGQGKSPVDLDQPSRLFTKKAKVAAPTGPIPDPPHQNLKPDDVVPVTDSPKASKSRTVHQIGPTIEIVGAGARTPWYRQIMVVEPDGRRWFTVENWSPEGRWAMRGSERGKIGGRLETATAAHAERTRAQVESAGGRYYHFEPSRIRREGLDRVAVLIAPDGTVRVQFIEVKRTASPTMREFTAIRENLLVNRDTVRTDLLAMRRLALAGQEPHGMVLHEIDAALAALNARRIDVQVVIGPESGLGPPTRGSLLDRLRSSVRARLGKGADVGLLPVVRLGWDDLAHIELAEHLGMIGSDQRRVAALAERAGVVPPEAVLQARAALKAESTGAVPPPVHRSNTPGALFYDGDGRPLHVASPPGGPSFDPDATAASLLADLRHREPHESVPGSLVERRVIVDTGRLTEQQVVAMKEALARHAASATASGLLTAIKFVEVR